MDEHALGSVPVATPRRRDNVTDAELALDADGTLPGAAGQDRSPISAPICRPRRRRFVGNLGTLAGVYRTPAIHADVTAVFTNTNPVRPYRGNGRARRRPM